MRPIANIRTVVASVIIGLYGAIGVGLLVSSMSDRLPWFKAATGFVVLGYGSYWLAQPKALAGIRQRWSLSGILTLRAACLAFGVAGILVAVGAVMALERGPGRVVAVAALGWSAVCAWVLWRSRGWVDPAVVEHRIRASMTFDLHLAEIGLGRLHTSDLSGIAMQASEEGYQSPALAALAGTLGGERSPFEIDELWMRALREVDKKVPGRIEAGHRLKRHLAGLVASGRVPPRTGAREIVRLHDDLNLPFHAHYGDGFGIAELIGHYYVYGDEAPRKKRLRRKLDALLKADCERLSREQA